MKINTLFIVAFIAFSFLLSCNNSDSKSDSTIKIGGLFDSKNDKISKANSIIQFNNKIVQIDNSHYNDMDGFNEAFDALDRYISTKLNDPKSISIPPIGRINSLSIHKIEGLIYPDGLSKEFKPLLDQMKDSHNTLLAIGKEMESYKSAEDWKEDNGAKLKSFKERAQIEITKNREASQNVFKKLKPIVDQAEEITLEDNPLKSQYIRSENILDKVLETTKSFFETENNTELKTEFAKNYQDLEKLLNENKKDQISNDYRAKAGAFERYNDAVNAFLGKMRIIQRNLDAGTEFEDTNIRALESASKQVLNTYNSFVD
mgnify:CR=1 FL=1